MHAYGKRAKAPCGHDGEHVVSQYIRCLRSDCDGRPGKLLCPKCGSKDVKPFICIGIPEGTMVCDQHGHLWHPGITGDDSSDDVG